MKISVEQLIEDLGYLSDRLSTQVRTIALSVLALIWLFLAGGDQAPHLVQYPPRWSLLAVAVLALLALAADHLQYVFGYVSSKRTLDGAEVAGVSETEIEYRTWPYRLRTGMFWTKQVFAFASVALLVGAIGAVLLGV
jgi:hypothetical protein